MSKQVEFNAFTHLIIMTILMNWFYIVFFWTLKAAFHRIVISFHS